MCYDVFFKAIFINHANLLAKMVSDITGIDYKDLEDNVTLETNELPVKRKEEKAKKCDFILRIDKDNIINLELNLENYPGLVVKNLSYLFHLFSTSTKSGKKYNNNLVVMQININCFKNNTIKRCLKKYSLREEDSYELYSKNVIIYDLNVAMCHQIYYNEKKKEKLPNYIKWGAFIYAKNIDEMPHILDSFLCKEMRNIIMAEVNKIEHNSLFYTEEEKAEWDEWERNSIRAYIEEEATKKGLEQGIEQGIEQGLEQGLEQGIEQGIEQEKINTIKNMLKNDVDLELISKITGKNLEEINKIINEQ